MGLKKLTRRVPLVIAILFLLGCFGIIVYEVVKPLDPWITVSGLHERTQNKEHGILVEADKVSCWTDPSTELADLCSFEDWKRVYTFSDDEEPLLTLEFQEEYVVEFYSGGRAVACNGYGRLGTAWSAFYEVPDGIVDRIMEYVQANRI